MHFGKSTRGAAALLTLGLTLAAAATTAQAAPQWYNGVSVQSTIYNPCLRSTEVGAVARAGYRIDPATTRAGDVFYGHAEFGAATYVGGGCSNIDQAAELDVVLPPGVRLAIDAKHRVQCFYADNSSGGQTDPKCPTKAINGVYGPQFTHGDGGGAWDMPPGREYEVVFPLVSTRALKGPAGGPCPQTLNDLSIDKQRDCLLIALHVADGTDDPWLLPNEQMIIAPGAGGRATLKAPRTVRLARLRTKGLAVTLKVPKAGGKATVTLRQGKRTVGRLTRRHLRKGKVTLRVRLSEAGRARLRHGAKLTVVVKLTKPKATLRASVAAKP
jgi:hypothetical protein